MKKTLVINTLSTSRDVSCCNVLKKVNWFKCLVSSKKLEEKELSEAFNEIGNQGYIFQDEKVLPHKLYVDNAFVETSFHGVYRFNKSTNSKYQVYFGPVIEVSPEDKKGCNGFGCKGIGCKTIKTNGIGCKSKGGNKQYINFYNNELNEDAVKALNKHFGFRQGEHNKEMDYVYRTYGRVLALNELVKQYYDQIREQYNKDVEEFYRQGLGYIKTIDTPSREDVLSQAMLFGSTSTQKVSLGQPVVNEQEIRLSRFDVWYYPRVKGLIRIILEKIAPFLFKKKEEEVTGTSIIEESNLDIVTTTYDNDFNSQEQAETTYMLQEITRIGQVPVTIAVKRKFGFWKGLFHGKEYDFYTYILDAVKP